MFDFMIFVYNSCATPVEIMATMEIMDRNFLVFYTVWTQWTLYYAVDTSAVEWGARVRRFESSNFSLQKNLTSINQIAVSPAIQGREVRRFLCKIQVERKNLLNPLMGFNNPEGVLRD